MRITDIAMTKKGRYAIHGDGEFLFSLHLDVLAAAHLKVGDEVEVEALEALREASELRITKDRALRLLSRQSYTAKVLGERLERYTDRDTATQVVERMEELGFVNDGDYAKRCAQDLFRLKHFSPKRIRQELRQRGIADHLIDEALEQFEEEDAFGELLRLVERKYAPALTTQKGRNRAVNGLLRLGYSYEDIRTALGQVIEEYGIEDEDPGDC